MLLKAGISHGYREFCILFTVLFILLIVGGCSRGRSDTTGKKVIILGFDGMDPGLLERFVREGKMPNFERLKKTGDYRKLETSIPPQSPVAWSNFITGMNPGGHGIFDFIHRNEQTIFPYLSTSKVMPAERKISIGGWVIPLSSDKVVLLRRGLAFWEILQEKNIPSTVIRVPANFPPVETKSESISGMGAPDIQGTYGMFSYYTTDNTQRGKEISGGKIFPVRLVNNRIEAAINGPKNTFKINAPMSIIKFSTIIDAKNPVAKIIIQENTIILKEGEWSPWIHVDFEIIPYIKKVGGICRFYLKQVHPVFKMYVTPVNIDPSNPAMPISTPDNFAKKLYEEVGPFYTQGIPEDTKALTSGIFDDDEFIEQASMVFNDSKILFKNELNRFKTGLLFFYFGSTDQVAHMFWRTMDASHPAHDSSRKNVDAIEKTYIKMDEILGMTLSKIDQKTTLIVLSDHGFAPFYRAFNLNTWLKKEGYIVLKNNYGKGEFFENVDWSLTKAYGYGFNSLYLNMKGREKNGIITQGEERKLLMKELENKLLALQDQKTGKRVVSRVYESENVYSGDHLKSAPDIIVGYNKGYRASWETALGIITDEVLSDNLEKWSGDHLIDHELVPGIILTNKKIKSDRPSLYDIAPTILREYGIETNKKMVGKSIF